MAGTFEPGQMFDHTQIELSGRSMMYALDFAAPIQDGEKVKEGGVITLNAEGKFVAGLGEGQANEALAGGITPMPLIAIQGTDAFDANSDKGNLSGGVQSGLVATGGYEIQTTEFVAGTYAVNSALTFAVGDDRGQVTVADAAYSTQHVLGVTSRGVISNAYNISTLSFWTVFAPAVKTS